MTTPTPRNLVVFCDGTGNLWDERRASNVVKLVRLCEKVEQQIVYYDPGVGTASDYPGVGALDNLRMRIRHLWGLAFGRGIYENIAAAYQFLVDNWREGDRIFLIGFSRGAFSARSVAGMINLFGIVRPAATVMVPTLLRIYFGKRSDDESSGADKRQGYADDIRANFTSPAGAVAKVHFVGVFDTVASVGGLRSLTITSNPTVLNKRFVHVRHAVSDGEYRAPYRPRLYAHGAETLLRDAGSSLQQLWFAGVHSDVGGSYPQNESVLSDAALHWLAEQARNVGLRLALPAPPTDAQIITAVAHDQATRGWTGWWWALAGLQRRPPAPAEHVHPSLALRQALPDAGMAPLPSLWRNRFFLIPLALALLVYALLALWTADIGRPGQTSALQLAGLQLAAAWTPVLAWRPYRGALGPVLWLDLALIALYGHLLCIGVVYSIRRLRHWQAGDTAAHRRLRHVSQGGLLAALLGDVVANLLTPSVASGGHAIAAGLLSLCAVLQWGGLLVLALLFAFAGVVGRPTAPAAA